MDAIYCPDDEYIMSELENFVNVSILQPYLDVKTSLDRTNDAENFRTPEEPGDLCYTHCYTHVVSWIGSKF